jgi:hypothetical protein
MKKLLFFIPLIAFGAATQAPSNYELLDAQGNVLEIFVATPEVAATYPACVQQIYHTAVTCVPYVAPIQPTVDITPVVATNNAVALPAATTNNASPIITTNNIAP